MMILTVLALFQATSGSLQPLALPVRCEPGRDCFVQKLVDHQPGPGRRDYRCGRLTTEEHDGVDIRLRTLSDMRRGFPVVAAADGLVLRVRDGQPDISVKGRPVPPSLMAGNGVVIDHGNGWETQYSHLRQASVRVRAGQRVKAGEQLGLIGLSGNTEFPHLHFEIRHRGVTIDPFTAKPMGTACTPAAVTGLWSRAASASLSYRPTAILALGFHAGQPEADRARAGAYEALVLGRSTPLVLWVDAFGTEDGDVQMFTITGPGGKEVHRQSIPVRAGALSWFAFSGKRAPDGGWAPGRYHGSYSLLRAGKPFASKQASVLVR